MVFKDSHRYTILQKANWEMNKSQLMSKSPDPVMGPPLARAAIALQAVFPEGPLSLNKAMPEPYSKPKIEKHLGEMDRHINQI